MACFGLMQSMIISGFFLSFVVALLPDSTLYFSNGNITSWTNNNQSLPQAIQFTDGSLARFILLKTETSTTGRFGFGFGFYYNFPYVGYCGLSIMFVDMLNGEVDLKGRPQVVWTANWNRPVGENATLKFNQGGYLSLIDEHDNEIWSAYSSGMSNIVGMSIDELGNMMLFDEIRQPVWESYQYPTDTLLVGQVIRVNQQLTSRSTSFHARQGLFNLSLNARAIVAFSVGDKVTQYLNIAPAMEDAVHGATQEDHHLKFVQFIMGGMGFYYQKQDRMEKRYVDAVSSSSNSTTIQFLRLDGDGGLRIYGWNPGEQWRSIFFWPNKSDECWIPLRCGRYGVCKWGTCGCPNGPDGKDYFTLRDYQHPNLGCREISPAIEVQNASTDYEMVHFGNLSYFGAFYAKWCYPWFSYTEESCKQACYEDTTCKAAFFVSKEITYEGYCYMYSDSEMLSLMGNPHEGGYYLSSYLKVTSLKLKANASSPPPGQGYTNSHSYPWRKTLLAAYSFLLTIVVLVAACFLLRKKINCARKRQKHLKSLISGSLKRFSYSEMSCATARFSTRLGRGGFGVVYKGVLKDGTMVAVKRLENTGEGGIEEFLAEVDTIGNIHHINLVKLIGFCIEKRHRILVYEYMSKGSLDKWIFHGCRLDWKTRKKIVLDIAKGLAYLHDDCRQRIAHLDVKPQNILLDDAFNAKVSDFGLSKLINRDESQVVTRMRGTLGYLAPEWQHARITVKADIYSFGIVVLEVVTGRMVLDYSQPDSDVCLLKLLKKKQVDNRVMDIIDPANEDVQPHFEEVNAMILLGLWCVNEDHTSRPSMNSVVKLLEQENMLSLFDTHFTNSL